jgi:hypothetical protein
MQRVVATLVLLTLVAVPTTTAAASGMDRSSAAGTAPGETAAVATAGSPWETTTRAGDALPAVQQANGSRITYFSLAGRGLLSNQDELVGDRDGTTYVWASESLEFRTTVRTDSTPRPRRACVHLLDGEGAVADTVGCEAWNSTTRHRWSRIELSAWPAGTSGTRSVRVELQARVRNESTSTDGSATEWVRRDTHEVDLSVISKQGDLDDDGLSNAREVELGTDFTRADSDGDGLSDRAEVFEYGSDPLAADTTGDGLEDGTVAGLGLPPTVPYVVHAAVTLGVLVLGTLVAAAVKLRRVLRARESRRGYGSAGYDAADHPAGQHGQRPRTKEDEVVDVLREHGAQMRQADLVDETEWSKATVSRLLSALEEEGRVEKIRVGRGNVVRLTEARPDDEPTQTSG